MLVFGVLMLLRIYRKNFGKSLKVEFRGWIGGMCPLCFWVLPDNFYCWLFGEEKGVYADSK